MNTANGLYVGVKLLGIYFLCIAVKDIPSALGAIGLTSEGEIGDPAGVLALYLISTIILLVIGMLLNFKTNSIHALISAERDEALGACPMSLGGALKLLGVYFAVTSLSRIISNIGVSVSNDSSLLVKVSLYGPCIITCILGLILAIKDQYIWDLISEERESV